MELLRLDNDKCTKITSDIVLGRNGLHGIKHSNSPVNGATKNVPQQKFPICTKTGIVSQSMQLAQ